MVGDLGLQPILQLWQCGVQLVSDPLGLTTLVLYDEEVLVFIF